MFLIVPKPRVPPKNTDHGESVNNGRHQALHRSSPTAFRGPTRVQNACDECRLRKVKCNGQQPCGRCRSRTAICVYDHGSSRTSGPASPAQVAMLRAQQARLILALKNMSAVIDELKERPSSQISMNTDFEEAVTDRPRATSYAEEENFDLTAVLEVYAPCQNVNGELQQTSSELASKTEHLHDGQIRSNKRLRQNQSPAASVMPASMQVQAEVTTSRENIPTSSCGAGTTSVATHIERNTGPSGLVHVTDENSQTTIESSVNNPRTTDSYSSFMAMLQSVRNSSAIFTQESAYNGHESYITGGSTADGGDPDHGTSLTNLSATQDSILDTAQFGPLIDMVDWNTSWENCAELLWNNQSHPTSEQELSRQYDLDWSVLP